MCEALPADAWRTVAQLSSLRDLARLRASASCAAAAAALHAALAGLRAVDLAAVPPPSRRVLAALFARCRSLETLAGLHCGNLASGTSAGSTEALPELPPSCRKLGLRFGDAWTPTSCSAFVKEVSAWVSAPLEHLTLAWNPPEDDGRVCSVAGAMKETWRAASLRSLVAHRAPPALGSVLMERAESEGAQLHVVHLVDVELPPTRNCFWRHLVELSFIHSKGPTPINDDLLAQIAQAGPPLRVLRLVDRREEASARPCVTIGGLVALRALLLGLEELRLARTFGVFCDAGDIDLLMFLGSALGSRLRHLDLEGFPRLSDGALLEMLDVAREGKSGVLQALRLLGTAVTDAAFVNGLDKALAPSLRELRLSGNPALGDSSLCCLAEAGRCQALERLALGGRGFGDVGLVAILASTRCLRALHLRESSITNEALENLVVHAPMLTEVGISGLPGLSDVGIKALCNLPLASLRIGSCSGVSNQGIADLLHVLGPRLSSLSLEYCSGLSNCCLSPLTRGACWLRLQHLRLVGIKVSGAVLHWCCAASGLPDLRRLQVWRARLPECFVEAEAEFRRRRPGVVLVLRRGGPLGWSNW